LKLSHKNIAIYIVITLMMVMLFKMFEAPKSDNSSVSYSDFLGMVEDESIIKVTIQGDNISGMSRQGIFKTFAPKDPELIKLLRSKGVEIDVKPDDDSHGSRRFSAGFPCCC
jgi:cell division protease FtsH